MGKRKTISGLGKIFLKNILFPLLTAFIIYIAAALVLSFTPTHPGEKACPSGTPIFITSNGVHLDIIIPVESLEPEFRSQLQVPESSRYVSFGWGDKVFYQKTPEWKDLSFPVAFRALFLQSETAMHVTQIHRRYPGWEEINLCSEQLDILNRYIENSFKKSSEGKIQKCKFPGYTSSDDFYVAKGSFSLFKTCNVWTSNALKETGIKTAVWSPFDFGVLHHLRNRSLQKVPWRPDKTK